jgi:hypothetical protein
MFEITNVYWIVCAKLKGKKFLRSTVDSAVTSPSSPRSVFECRTYAPNWCFCLKFCLCICLVRTKWDEVLTPLFVLSNKKCLFISTEKDARECHDVYWCNLEPHNMCDSLPTFWRPLIGKFSKFLFDFESCWIPWWFHTPSRVHLPFYHI